MKLDLSRSDLAESTVLKILHQVNLMKLEELHLGFLRMGQKQAFAMLCKLISESKPNKGFGSLLKIKIPALDYNQNLNFAKAF